MKSWVVKMLAMLLLCRSGYSQGFANLDFENPVLPLTPVLNQVPTADAIPGWTAYYSNFGTNAQSQIWYDNVSLGGAFIALENTNNISPAPLQGSYSVLLEGQSGGSTPPSASIGQTGEFPLNALSLTFFLSLNSSLQVTFDGQIISLIQIGSAPNYVIMGGDISAYAGQTGQLMFTALGGPNNNVGYGLLDNIQFSSTSVPEPSSLGLAALGGLLFAWQRLKKCTV